jgi:hypothetical protein
VSEVTPDTDTCDAENSMGAPTASRAAIRSLTISVCAYTVTVRPTSSRKFTW